MSTKKTKVLTEEFVTPNEDTYSKVCITKQTIEISSIKYVSANFNRYQKIDKNHYVDKETGELLEYQHKENRSLNPESLKKSYKKLRRLILNNFSGQDDEIFITLTYRNFTNANTVLENYKLDFKSFWKELKKHYPDCQYISVAEPQRTGSIHFHVLVKQESGEKLYIPYTDIESWWNNGYVKVERIRSINSLAVYLTPSLSENNKSSRARFYPSNFRLYRYSNGIKRPKEFSTTYGEAIKLVDGKNPTFSCTYKIVGETQNGTEVEVNSIGYQNFKNK